MTDCSSDCIIITIIITMPITTIIQAAQERESLQREGDQLNEAIKVAEKEIRLLQRTLQSLVIRNDNFRASFHKVCARESVLYRPVCFFLPLGLHHHTLVRSCFRSHSSEITLTF